MTHDLTACGYGGCRQHVETTSQRDERLAHERACMDAGRPVWNQAFAWTT